MTKRPDVISQDKSIFLQDDFLKNPYGQLTHTDVHTSIAALVFNEALKGFNIKK